MSRKPQSLSLLEVVLARMRRQEDNPWGRMQRLGHLWLTRLEGHSFIRNYKALWRRSSSGITLHSEPAINLDSVFFLSLLFHLLLLFILSWITFSSRPLAKPGPVFVRFLDIGKQTQRQPSKPRKAVVKKSAVVPPKPKPAPLLPAPKVLAKLPKEDRASLRAESADALVRLPTRQSSSAHAPQVQVETAPVTPVEMVSRDELEVPKELLKGEAPSARKGSPSALSSPDFAPYLEMIKRRVQSVWRYPEGISGVHKVNLVFVLDRGGQLARVEVVESADSKLDGSAMQAMKRASPFPPIPDSLKDLAGWPLRIRFTIDFGVKVAR